LLFSGNLSNQDVVVVDDEYWINGAMAKACPTITIECLIEIIAFLAISISPIPGLRSFGQVPITCLPLISLLVSLP
jgi:predicted exporter